MEKTILILSYPEDPHVAAVLEQLEKKKIRYKLVNFSMFPTASELSVRLTNHTNKKDAMVKIKNECLDQAFHSIWYRRPGVVALPSTRDKSIKQYIKTETEEFLKNISALFPNAFLFPDPVQQRQAKNKLHQLRVAQMVGLSIPDTCMGNDREQANRMFETYPELILKPFDMGSYHRQPGLFGTLKKNIWEFFHSKATKDHFMLQGKYREYTIMASQKVGKAEKEAVLANIATCPVTLQQYIPKKLELRITVVGKKIFPCAIYSQDTAASAVDWRGFEDNIRHESYQLPKEVETRCFDLLKRLGLEFGCIDMIVTPEDEHVFLEINPNGQWFWIQDKTGMPIAEAIADLLITQDRLCAPEAKVPA